MDVRIFLRKDHTNKDGTQGIYLRYTIDRKTKKDFTLNLPINPNFWDENLCRVNKKGSFAP